MPLTHFDFYIFRGKEANLVTSSFVALNPTRLPGSFVLGGSTAVSASIGSQVACRLALEHFVDGVLAFFEKRSSAGKNAEQQSEISLEVLEAAFKNSNSSVYNFGHKLAAGGRMSASLTGLVIHENMIAAGRVGAGGAYLVRAGKVFPFFETPATGGAGAPQSNYLGAQSLVSVELASIPAQENDIIFLISEPLNAEREASLAETINDEDIQSSINPSARLCAKLFPSQEKIPFAMLMRIGPNTIYLRPI